MLAIWKKEMEDNDICSLFPESPLLSEKIKKRLEKLFKRYYTNE
jgi:hypothetical protein